MNKGIIVTLVIAVAIAVVTVPIFIGYSNDEVDVRILAEQQEKTCMAFFDKMWKIISTKADVAEKYAESFKDIYVEIMEGRYGDEKGGSLMKWIQEANPEFDASLFKGIQTSIEVERTGFFVEQKKLISYEGTHKQLLRKFPSGFFLMFRDPLEITLITSGKTEATYETGREDDVNPFGKK